MVIQIFCSFHFMLLNYRAKPILLKPKWSPRGVWLVDRVLSNGNPTTKVSKTLKFHILPSLRCCERHCRLMASWPWYHCFVYESNGLRLQWLAWWVALTLATAKLYSLTASIVVSGFYTHILFHRNHWQWEFFLFLIVALLLVFPLSRWDP